MFTFVSESQKPKAACSILFTLSGIVTLVSNGQCAKANCPILVTLSGIFTVTRYFEPSKAAVLISVTVFGIVYNVIFLAIGYLSKTVLFLLNNTPSTLVNLMFSLETFIFSSDSQSIKAYSLK